MRPFVSSVLLALLAASALAALSDSNPYLGARQFVDNNFSTKMQNSINTLRSQGNTATAELFRIARTVPSAIWLDTIANMHSKLPPTLEAIKKVAATSTQPIIATLVVYDLPGRDCSAGSSAGELAGPAQLPRYRTEFIDGIYNYLKNYQSPKIRFSIVLEPDSLPNAVTNLNMPFCAQMANTYKDGVAYAIKTFSALNNTATYMDLAWTGWLGYSDKPANIIKVYSDVLTRAGGSLAAGVKMIRGFVTNVSNYSPFVNRNDPRKPRFLSNSDEQSFINSISKEFVKAGIKGKGFIVDSSRNGRGGIRDYGSWCNVKGAGLGPRPTTNTNDPLVDAVVWVKTPGESDGNSNDPGCNGPDSLVPSPSSGQWNHNHIVLMVQNANPPITQADYLIGTDPDKK